MEIKKDEYPNNKDIFDAFDTLTRNIKPSEIGYISIQSTEELLHRYKYFKDILISVEEMLEKILPQKVRLSEAIDAFIENKSHLNNTTVTTDEYLSKEIKLEFSRMKKSVFEMVSKRTQEVLKAIPNLPPTQNWIDKKKEKIAGSTYRPKKNAYKKLQHLQIFSHIEKEEILSHLENIGIIKEFSSYASSSPSNSRLYIAPWVHIDHTIRSSMDISIDWDMIPEQSAEILLDEEKAKTRFFIEHKNNLKQKKEEEIQRQKQKMQENKESLRILKTDLLTKIQNIEGVEYLSLKDVDNEIVFEEILYQLDFNYDSVATFADETEVILLIKEGLQDYLSAQ